MESIATYSEVRFDGSRTFALLPDRIIVSGKQSLQSEFEMAIALTSLNPNPGKYWLRNPSFIVGMWLALGAFIICSILVSCFSVSFAAFGPCLLVAMGLGGGILMLATFFKVEFVRFQNDGGIVILDLARAGKSAAQLDSFIDALTKQIRIARGMV